MQYNLTTINVVIAYFDESLCMEQVKESLDLLFLGEKSAPGHKVNKLITLALFIVRYLASHLCCLLILALLTQTICVPSRVSDRENMVSIPLVHQRNGHSTFHSR